jgi:hypothetical protein
MGSVKEVLKITREAPQSGFNHEHTCYSQVEKLILQGASPGPLSICEELDVQHNNELIHVSFWVDPLSAESCMSILL